MTFSNVRRRLRIPPKRVAVSERFHSALLAFFFNIPAINMILTAVLGVSLMSFLYAFTVGCILLSFAACGGILRLRTGGLYPAALAAFLLILYLTGILCGMVSGVDVGRFLLLSLLPLLLPVMLSFDRADFLRFSMVFTAPGIFFLPRIFAVEPVNRTITMGVSYAFLLPVLCALLYLFFLRKEDPPRRRAFMLILATIQAVYAAQIFLYGTRGAVFSIALCAALAVCVRVRRRGGISLYPRRTVLLTVLLLLLFLFFWDLLGALHGLLASRSLSVRFIGQASGASPGGRHPQRQKGVLPCRMGGDLCRRFSDAFRARHFHLCGKHRHGLPAQFSVTASLRRWSSAFLPGGNSACMACRRNLTAL